MIGERVDVEDFDHAVASGGEAEFCIQAADAEGVVGIGALAGGSDAEEADAAGAVDFDDAIAFRATGGVAAGGGVGAGGDFDVVGQELDGRRAVDVVDFEEGMEGVGVQGEAGGEEGGGGDVAEAAG